MNGTLECGNSFSHSHVAEGPIAGIWRRPMTFEDMQPVYGHKHNFDHATFIYAGSVSIKAWRDGQTPENVEARKFSAPAWIEIAKDLCHEITPLEKGTMGVCIYSLRDGQGQVTDTWDGRMKPYA